MRTEDLLRKEIEGLRHQLQAARRDNKPELVDESRVEEKFINALTCPALDR